MSGFDFGDKFAASSERLEHEKAKRLSASGRLMPFGISFLDDVFVGIHQTDLIVVGAESGAGKTSVAMDIAQNAASKGRRVHLMALEAHDSEIEQRMLYRVFSNMAYQRSEKWRHSISFTDWCLGRCSGEGIDQLLDEAKEIVQKQTKTLYTYYRGASITAKDVARQLHAIRNETDLIILDHLHYIDSEDANENRALKDAIMTIRNTAIAMERPVIVIAHLRKKDYRKPRLIPSIDDFHGSSDITKVATKVVLLAPARDKTATEDWAYPTYMAVAKDRIGGRTKHSALMMFDRRSFSYQSAYRLGQLNLEGDEWSEIPATERLPRWALRAVK